MISRLGALFLLLSALCGCFATYSGPTIISVSDLTPPATSGFTARETAFTVIMDRFRDERSNRSILGQYDNLGKGGFAGTVTITADRDITEVFEDVVKKSLNRKGIRQGDSPFILRGIIKKANVGAGPNTLTIRAEVFLELTITDSNTGAYIWKKSFLGVASGVDPKITLANAFQDMAVAVDQDDSLFALKQIFFASGGRLPDNATSLPSAQAVPVKSVLSDVDELPAIKSKPNKNAYAIIIGIETYRQKLPKADFAVSDANLVGEYLIRAMGYPEENVVTLLNDRATNVDLAKYFEKWLPNNVEKGGTVFVYYSGHGAPNPRTGDAYLVPYDGDPSFIDQTGYSLKRMYAALGKLPAKEIVVALDSCFSGAGGRSVLAEGARPLVMNLQTSFALAGNIKVMAAASGDQISSTYKDKGHGLFTYFMLKGIKNEDVLNPDGSVRTDDLFGYIKPQVERIARKQYNNEQTPQLIGGK